MSKCNDKNVCARFYHWQAACELHDMPFYAIVQDEKKHPLFVTEGRTDKGSGCGLLIRFCPFCGGKIYDGPDYDY